MLIPRAASIFGHGSHLDHSRRSRSHVSTLPFGSVAVELERAPDRSVGIWLDYATVAKFKAARGPGESFSDAILRLAEDVAGGR
jgi:hypothetical protein